MAKPCSLRYTARGVTMLWRRSRFVCWHKCMNMRPLSFLSCMWLCQRCIFALADSHHSADLEITVPLLVQVDKLVQLIESPVFTCVSLCITPRTLLTSQPLRPTTTAAGAGEIPTPLQVSIWLINGATTELRFRLVAKSTQRSELSRVPPHRAQIVSVFIVSISTQTYHIQDDREHLVNAIQTRSGRHQVARTARPLPARPRATREGAAAGAWDGHDAIRWILDQ